MRAATKRRAPTTPGCQSSTKGQYNLPLVRVRYIGGFHSLRPTGKRVLVDHSSHSRYPYLVVFAIIIVEAMRMHVPVTKNSS